MKIKAFYPNYFFDVAITGAAYRIIRGMQSAEHDITLMGIASEKSFQEKFYTDAVPKWVKKIVLKFVSIKLLTKFAHCRFVRSLKSADYAYLWPGVNLSTYQAIKNKGYKIIHECVNTHEANSKSILDAAYAQLNLPAKHGMNAQSIDVELKKLALSDLIFSCSPLMTDLLIKIGISRHKILQTSYGLSESFIANSSILQSQTKPFVNQSKLTFIFVGSISVRKGAHLLLDYWVKANLDANLKLVGTIEPALKPLIAQYINQHNVTHIPFTDDLPSIYKQADIFILPSLEEGSPLVTYMAMGAGLPMLLTPMSAGGVVTNGVEGFVIEPYDAINWVNAMRKITEDTELRSQFAAAAKNKASNYIWDTVAKQRLKLLQMANNKT